MVGDERSRICGECALHVHDIASLERRDALALVRAHEGRRLCLRLWRRADGRVLTRDCPRGVRERVSRASARAVLVVLCVLGFGGMLHGANHVRPGVEAWLAKTFPSWFGPDLPFVGMF